MLIGVGSWTIAQKAFVTELLGTNLFLGMFLSLRIPITNFLLGAVYILIATGVVVSLVAFFGCLGAVKEIKCMLLMVKLIKCHLNGH